ncbi:MAG: helix-turn-helix domain-containing protein [Coriobacteriia bacterium]|nr:helix-turn-helix domain-containing protein [Coriobacteriia bacterium]
MYDAIHEEAEIGATIRQARIRNGFSLEDVAARANLSPTAVRNLELGRGSTLRTMIKVLTVIGEMRVFTEWHESSKEFSPIAVFRETQRKVARPQRVSRTRVVSPIGNHADTSAKTSADTSAKTSAGSPIGNRADTSIRNSTDTSIKAEDEHGL